jgi:hypothetical protein
MMAMTPESDLGSARIRSVGPKGVSHQEPFILSAASFRGGFSSTLSKIQFSANKRAQSPIHHLGSSVLSVSPWRHPFLLLSSS